jgi:hypothetical protein
VVNKVPDLVWTGLGIKAARNRLNGFAEDLTSSFLGVTRGQLVSGGLP